VRLHISFNILLTVQKHLTITTMKTNSPPPAPQITPPPAQANHPLQARAQAPVVLTTVFTAPLLCTLLSRRYYEIGCLPSSRGSGYFQTNYFSPGICPLGWTPACERPTTVYSKSIPYGSGLLAGETATICCPM
jgi:hypothetical protein